MNKEKAVKDRLLHILVDKYIVYLPSSLERFLR